MTTDLGIWLAVLATLAVYSYLYKENPVFRVAEHLYVGASAAHAVVMAIGNIRDLDVKPLLSGRLVALIPMVLGLMFYARYFGRPDIARIPVAVVMGIGAGTALRSMPGASVLAQIQATILPLDSVNNVILVVGVIATLSYFLFTTGKGRVNGYVASVGKVVMMVSFGASFGATVFAGHSLVVGSLQLLLGDWLHVLAR